MTERALTDATARELKRRGAWHFKIHETGAGRNGLPDIVACYHGRMLCLELKAPGGRHPISALQRHELRCATNAGAYAYVIRQLSEVRAILNYIDHTNGSERAA